MLYSKILDLWISEKSLEIRNSTKWNYICTINRELKPAFGDYLVKEITRTMLQDYILKKSEHLKTETIINITKVLSQSFKFAKQEGYVEENPYVRIKVPKEQSAKEIKVFTQEEIAALLNVQGFHEQIVDIVNIAYRTGMRIGEILALKWEDVNFEQEFLMVRRTVSHCQNGVREICAPKTKASTRRIDLDKATMQMLLSMDRTGDFVFCKKDGTILSRGGICQSFKRLCKKEQARQEQLALKEQMKQEAEERKALEIERKKVEKEESKYTAEIEKLKEQIASSKDEELEKLNARILELQNQLSSVVLKKEEISNLANGKAGNVYIISNLGSFGENVFKVGMTRRLNPQDRVNELGDASVPFKFDVHSFIFSDDAVGLENKLHTILNNKRVNKVNMRKEFFYTNIDELENLVMEIEPTAEFNRTMLAEEFRQSQSTAENYTSNFVTEDFDEE